MSTIDVKPTPPPNPRAATKVKVPLPPEGAANLEDKALKADAPPPEDPKVRFADPKTNPKGTFGGQTIPLLPTIGRGPRVRGADVHNVNVIDKAIEWYIIIEPLENSRFAEHCVCRECHWGTYGYAPGDDGVKELKKHVQNQHIFSA